MNKEDLLGARVRNAENEEWAIEAVYQEDDPKETIVRLSNKKSYRLYDAYAKKRFSFLDERLNEILDRLVMDDQREAKKQEEEEERKRQEAERIAQEEMEGRKNPITKFKDTFLSNMYPCQVRYKGYTYRCSEAAYQAQKNPRRAIEFTEIDGYTAKERGKHVAIRGGSYAWNKKRVQIMEEVVRAKFAQNEDMKQRLLDTGIRYLGEGSKWGDRFWGEVSGVGENHLGKILMKIRRELRKEETH